MFTVVWELNDDEQDRHDYPSLHEAIDGLAFWAREHADRLNWIQIEFPNYKS